LSLFSNSLSTSVEPIEHRSHWKRNKVMNVGFSFITLPSSPMNLSGAILWQTTSPSIDAELMEHWWCMMSTLRRWQRWIKVWDSRWLRKCQRKASFLIQWITSWSNKAEPTKHGWYYDAWCKHRRNDKGKMSNF